MSEGSDSARVGSVAKPKVVKQQVISSRVIAKANPDEDLIVSPSKEGRARSRPAFHDSGALSLFSNRERDNGMASRVAL